MLLAPTRLFTGEEMIEGASVRIENGRIAEVSRAAAPGATKLNGLLAPGFVDIQVNGGGGVLFNEDTTADALARIAAAHRAFGVTGFMATLVSDSRPKIAAAFEAVTEAIADALPGLLGLHLEGPWLSDPRRGVHPSRFLRPLDDEDMAQLTTNRSFPIMVTVAPEQASSNQIRALVKANVIVSLGHTAASGEEVSARLAAGASGFTHLFNAMPPLAGREPGAVGAALAHRNAWAGLILDGIHVHPLSARAAFAAKGADRLVLVSDAMSTIGSPEPSMQLFGETITVKDGALRTANGTLAGAHLELSTALRNAMSLLGATTEEALRMVSRTPAEAMGATDRGRIAVRARADLVLLDEQLRVRGVWIDGKSDS